MVLLSFQILGHCSNSDITPQAGVLWAHLGYPNVTAQYISTVQIKNHQYAIISIEAEIVRAEKKVIIIVAATDIKPYIFGRLVGKLPMCGLRN
jgi:CDP-diglyceride synthetase